MTKHLHKLVTAVIALYLIFPIQFGNAALGSLNALMSFGMPAQLANYISTKLIAVNSNGDLSLPVASGKVAVVTGGSLALTTAGSTLQLQEGTAASACMGTLTLTAATPVVTSTTCAKTASRIFLTRTGTIDGDTTGDMSVTAITDGVSFAVTSEANDTATVNWLIINEAA